MNDDVTIERWRNGSDEPTVYLDHGIEHASNVIKQLRVYIQRGEFSLTIWFEANL